MSPTTRLFAVALIAATMATGTGCVQSAGPGDPQRGVVVDAAPGAPSAASGDEVMVISGTMVKPYLTVDELAADSSTLVVGTVTDSAEVSIHDLLFTRYTVRVADTLAGETSQEIDVYMVGDKTWQLDLEVPAHLAVGDTYALFLRPTALDKDQEAASGYYIVGPGAWAKSDKGSFSLWRQSRFDLGSIPTTFFWDDVAEELAVAKVGSALTQ